MQGRAALTEAGGENDARILFQRQGASMDAEIERLLQELEKAMTGFFAGGEQDPALYRARTELQAHADFRSIIEEYQDAVFRAVTAGTAQWLLAHASQEKTNNDR
jgi:hypothetical protein